MVTGDRRDTSLLEYSATEGDSPVHVVSIDSRQLSVFERVGLFEIATLRREVSPS